MIGSSNIPIVCADAMVESGDAIVADDGGVMVVPAALVQRTARAAAVRKANQGSKCAKPRAVPDARTARPGGAEIHRLNFGSANSAASE